MARPRIALVIPTLNEEEAIGGVLAAVPRETIDEIIVADSSSADRTVERAQAAGARVVSLRRHGYGRACRAGAEAAQGCDIVVFLDGDGSDCPELIPHLIAPIVEGRCDFVIGSRTRGTREPGSMTPHQLLAGRVIGAAVWLLYRVGFSDMCPFRAIRREALLQLGMREETYGWNLEMQMRAARA
ncbi:MAG: glycosyltransferase family 2 protein, partial [Stellaceae bacterium]